PPDTGYIAPSSAWHRARRMTTTPAMTQSMTAAPPTSVAAPSGANSQPDPMIDVSDAQAAPIRPSSRFRPVSAGVVVAAVLPVVMKVSSFLVSRSCAPQTCHPLRRGPAKSEVSIVQSEEHRRDDDQP